MSRNIKNGKPCDCFCGGSSGDGGGGLPPGSQDPLTSSGNGPYKVYAGTISIGGLPKVVKKEDQTLGLMAAIS